MNMFVGGGYGTNAYHRWIVSSGRGLWYDSVGMETLEIPRECSGGIIFCVISDTRRLCV